MLSLYIVLCIASLYTPRCVSTPRDTLNTFVATAHGLPCLGCGPGRSLLGPCAGTNTNTNTTTLCWYPDSRDSEENLHTITNDCTKYRHFFFTQIL
ncbi:uncharacterized protein EV420DRAFT_1556616 [Desarmillaria tabescens]|uniref:Secreted protein n=1 Tax=Armillaria tabescens TaxID=1929756 RepID=A0AA39N1L7_ARMTA|nr:uncharacterized protein EV420DRAFT_1556616 [Desarmillaria tabescens]KAK0454069.1 hypothetical protein EV420DRAFT_1556616 [Desarmillaria tabescens]